MRLKSSTVNLSLSVKRFVSIFLEFMRATESYFRSMIKLRFVRITLTIESKFTEHRNYEFTFMRLFGEYRIRIKQSTFLTN